MICMSLRDREISGVLGDLCRGPLNVRRKCSSVDPHEKGMLDECALPTTNNVSHCNVRNGELSYCMLPARLRQSQYSEPTIRTSVPMLRPALTVDNIYIPRETLEMAMTTLANTCVDRTRNRVVEVEVVLRATPCFELWA